LESIERRAILTLAFIEIKFISGSIILAQRQQGASVHQKIVITEKYLVYLSVVVSISLKLLFIK
jgi:hypothetical protein